MIIKPHATAALIAACLCACSPPQASTPPLAIASIPEQAAPIAGTGNTLRFTLDGVEWSADRELFGAVHPSGFDRAVLMAGSRGPKDANEQAFNLHLVGVDGPGVFAVSGTSPLGHVAQFGNLSTERALIGGPMGFDLEVTLRRADRLPVWIEASFEGHLIANDGAVLPLRHGEFRYRE